jgi:hypothetical protein
MGALLAALIGILALFGLVILLVLGWRTLPARFRASVSCMPTWNGHTAVAFFNHPPQVWAAP